MVFEYQPKESVMANVYLTHTMKNGRRVNVRPDTLDFRDKMFEPTLVEVPSKIDLEEYRKHEIPILNQGNEGACTGFGLATVVNYLLRTRKHVPDKAKVSPWMLYELAKRYDEWPGEAYDGSSARGAMKGWHKHGVCDDKLFPKNQRQPTPQAAKEATMRPLGAYYRVNHKDLVAMHSAIAEVGILYATASVHDGWDNVKSDGIIKFIDHTLGGHAFAIVAYDDQGFWIQNSWGAEWGKNGFCHITYDDWLANGTDVWVARLGAPVILRTAAAVATRQSATITSADALTNYELRRHIISLGNYGSLKPSGTYGTGKDEVRHIFTDYFKETTHKWKTKRILLYAHGGLVDEASAVQHLADYRQAMLDAEVYPVFFIWHTDFWSTLSNILEDAVKQRKPEGILDTAKDFMLDRLDDVLEPIAGGLGGKRMWSEMKQNAEGASGQKGGASYAAGCLKALTKDEPSLEIHLAGHSAGSIFHAYLIKLLTQKYKLKAKTCTLWAPACTTKLFKDAYAPAIKNKKIERFALFTLTDKTEQDDNCAKVYNKSLLYLVANAFEDSKHIPGFQDGEPLLGMAKFIKKDEEIKKLIADKRVEWVLAPNTSQNPPSCSTAQRHGDFDDDIPTVKATLARILGVGKTGARMNFNRSRAASEERRLKLYK